MEKLQIAVNGAGGRMGRRIISLLDRDQECELVCALESEESPVLGRDAGEVAGSGPLGVEIASKTSGSPQVLIDFSKPEGCLQRLDDFAGDGEGVVVGTTGFNDEQLGRLEGVSEHIPILLAPNMSLGVNLMFKLAPEIAAALGKSYDIEIVEAHHREKKDAPSGTAGKLGEVICSALERNPEKVITHGREGLTGRRPSPQIGMHAIRGGDIVGEHTVVFAGDGERIELTHRASSRDVFASGALNAAKFIRGRENGLYSMENMLF